MSDKLTKLQEQVNILFKNSKRLSLVKYSTNLENNEKELTDQILKKYSDFFNISYEKQKFFDLKIENSKETLNDTTLLRTQISLDFANTTFDEIQLDKILFIIEILKQNDFFINFA
jgi:hypothetical protein